ncbi:MAG: hypothetical protein KY468_20205 [Armatimonadetes bacterium]|nr:hypothetical protein [Armatimonadota bacterium]
MRPKEEQIKAILSGDPFRWAVEQLADHETMDEKRYSDFINVTPEEAEEFVKEHGFPEDAVCDETKGPPFIREDRLCIESLNNRWDVYYFERGHYNQFTHHTSYEEARREIINRMIQSAKIALNSRFRYAHPELKLPLPDLME